MPKITLNHEILSDYDHNVVSPVLSYMQSIAEENEDFNRTIHVTVTKLYAVYKNEAEKVTVRTNALKLAKEYLCFLMGAPKEKERFINDRILETFIEGSQRDAERAQGIKTFIQSLRNQEVVELSVLATFLFTLKLEFERMCGIANQSLPEKEMIEKLMLTLEPLVLTNNEKLQRLYHFCTKMFDYKPNFDIKGEASLQGTTGTLFLSSKYFIRYLNACTKMAKVLDFASKVESETLDRIFEKITQSILLSKPDCYSLTLDNYTAYSFGNFYHMAWIYETLRTRKVNVKKEQEEKEKLEWEALEKETEELINESKRLSLDKANAHKATKKEIGQEYNLLFSEAETRGLAEQLAPLSKEHLSILLKLYNKKEAVTFSDFAKAIKAFGKGAGVRIIDGSKTRIYLPGVFFNLPSEVVVGGGLHKNHEEAKPLHFIQRRLAVKALERAGLTESILQGVLEQKLKGKAEVIPLMQKNMKEKEHELKQEGKRLHSSSKAKEEMKQEPKGRK